jgi:hypothetical protein
MWVMGANVSRAGERRLWGRTSAAVHRGGNDWFRRIPADHGRIVVRPELPGSPLQQEINPLLSDASSDGVARHHRCRSGRHQANADKRKYRSEQETQTTFRSS